MGLGWIHDPRLEALPTDGTHGGARLQLVDTLRAARQPPQTPRSDHQSTFVVARCRHPNPTRRPNPSHHHQHACQTGRHTSGVDEPCTVLGLTEVHCGAADRYATAARHPRKRICEIHARYGRPPRPYWRLKYRGYEGPTAVFRLNALRVAGILFPPLRALFLV